MNLAIASTGKTMDNDVAKNLGSCDCYLIIEPDENKIVKINNPFKETGGGGSKEIISELINYHVNVIVTCWCGPNVIRAFNKAGIKVVTGVRGKVKNILSQLQDETLYNDSLTYDITSLFERNDSYDFTEYDMKFEPGCGSAPIYGSDYTTPLQDRI